MTKTKTPPQSKIPDFKSHEEEAEFWDTHSITDFMDELKEVKVNVSPNLTSVMTVRLNDEVYAELRQKAEKKGLGVTSYTRMVVMDHLEEDKKKNRK